MSKSRGVLPEWEGRPYCVILYLRGNYVSALCRSKPFTSYELAVIIADGPLFGRLAGKFSALEAKFNAFSEGTCSYSAKLILFGCTPALPVRALSFDHRGTLFTSNSTDTYLHLSSPVRNPPEADASMTSFFNLHFSFCNLNLEFTSAILPSPTHILHPALLSLQSEILRLASPPLQRPHRHNEECNSKREQHHHIKPDASNAPAPEYH